MPLLRKTALLGLALCGSIALSGCIVVAAGAGVATAMYVAGDLEARLEGSPPQIIEAAKKALEEMEIRTVSSDATGIDGKVVGRTALDRKVDITVRRDGETASKIWIRIDTFGDEALSRDILTKIESKL